MAVRNKTAFVPNGIYFVTFTILKWKNIFESEKYFKLVYKWFDYMKDNYGNKIHGYVIMPNHIHALLYLSKKSHELSILIFNAKKFLGFGIRDLLKEDNKIDLLSFFAKNKSKTRANFKFFEPRYDSLLIQTQKFYLEKLNYIHNNPCSSKWNLAEYPEDYRYSSASNYIKGHGLCDIDITGF